MLPSINNVLVFLLLSSGLRWFIFQYKLLYPVRDWLEDKHPFFTELFHCPYCQTFESSAVVYLLLQMPFGWVTGFLCCLFNAYVAIAIESLIESQIEELEGSFEFEIDSELDKN